MLETERRAVRVRVAGRGAADRGRGRRPLSGRARRDAAERPARGVPDGVRPRCSSATARPQVGARARPVHDRGGERALRPRRRAAAARARAGRASSSAASSGPAGPSANGAIPTSCAGSAARRSQRSGGRSSRSSRSAFARFLPGWHGIDRRATLREALVPLQGAAAPRLAVGVGGASAPRAELRAGPARPARAPPASSSGSARASTALPCSSARTLRCSVVRTGRTGRRARSTTAFARHSAAARSSGSIWSTKSASIPPSSCPRSGIWCGPARSRTTRGRRSARAGATARPKPERRPRRFSRRRATAITATQGAGPSTERLFAGELDRRALAELLLERQGIVTRDGVRAEGIAGGYTAVYGELKALETLGLSRRGYFVEGLGGAQFALGGAVERIRELGRRGRRAGGAARARRSRSRPALRRRAAVAEES